MQKRGNAKYLPLVLMMIALVLGLSYFHESEVTADTQDEISHSQASPVR
jgi:hypothetical protein